MASSSYESVICVRGCTCQRSSFPTTCPRSCRWATEHSVHRRRSVRLVRLRLCSPTGRGASCMVVISRGEACSVSRQVSPRVQRCDRNLAGLGEISHRHRAAWRARRPRCLPLLFAAPDRQSFPVLTFTHAGKVRCGKCSAGWWKRDSAHTIAVRRQLLS